jgi:ABC-type multidrug transport system ATPase subunit
MFQMNPDDFCTCPNTTKGWDCALANPNYPCPSGQQYDNQWLNDVNPDKLIQCVAVPPYPGFLSLITFVHTRLEMHVYNGTSFRATIYGREYKATRQQCEQVAPILDCNFTGCDGTAFSDGTTSYDNCAITECTQFSFMNITSGYAKFDKPFADGWALGEINTDTSIGPLNLLLNCSIGGCSPGVEANVFTQVQYDIFYSTLGTVGIITAALAVTIIVLVFGFRHRPNLSQTYQKVKEKPSETSTSLSNGFSTETSKVSAGASSDEKTLAGSGTLSGKDDSAAAIVFSSVEFDPNVASLVFDKVNYIIPEISRQILTNISGYAQRGNVTAIMGLSGSGKTSLLEILCGYRRISSGKVFATKCDNKPAADVIQFVAQQDLLQAELTVHEAMLFTCQLRCRMSLEDCKKRVQDKLELLRLTHLTNNLIGDPFHGGLSGGQRRLTSVAMELLSEPLFLVLDEPASGLDSNNAEHLFEVLRAVASQNCGVVLTVHAPSTKLLSMMDILLVLSPIGHMGYFGPPKVMYVWFNTVSS